MSEEPERGSNAKEASLEPTERRDLIKLTIEIARWTSETYGRWPTVMEVEAHLEGKRTI